MITQLLPLIAKSMCTIARPHLGGKKWSSMENETVVLVNVTELN